MGIHPSAIAAPPTVSARRALALLAAFALAIALIAPLEPAEARPTNGEDDPSQVFAERLAGDTRHGTACAVAVETFGTAPTVLLSRDDHWADALVGSYLAGQLAAPILLTDPDALTDVTEDCLESLGTDEVVILGGEAAVSLEVEAALEAEDHEVTRIAGENRFETARLIAEEGDGVGATEHGATAIVATGTDFADALVSGGVAYDGAFPLLLTTPNALHVDTAAALDGLAIDHVIIPGGTAAVSQAVQDAIEADEMTTTRLAGERRTQTATLVADWALANLGWDETHVNLARGDHFADAMSFGPYAGENEAPVVLSAGPDALDVVVAHTGRWLRANSCRSRTMTVAGGSDAVSDVTVEAAGVAASDCGYFPTWEQTFDGDTAGWFDGTDEGPDGWCGRVEHHEAGAGPVGEPSTGGGYAVATRDGCNDFWQEAGIPDEGPYGLGAGYATWFPPEGYEVHLDVYLDPDAFADGERFDLLASISLLGERPRDWDDVRDHELYYLEVPVEKDDGELTVAGSEPVVVAGWYTFSHTFTADHDGMLDVMFELSSDGEVVHWMHHTELIVGQDEEGAPIIEDVDTVAAAETGSGYIWLSPHAGVQVPIDNHRVHRAYEPVFPTWHQDFEMDLRGWYRSETPGTDGGCGTLELTDDDHAVAAHGECNEFWAALLPDGSGPYGLGAGYSAAFPEEGYEVLLDVRLDPETDAAEDGFLFSVIPSISMLDGRERDWETILDHTLYHFMTIVNAEGGDIVVSVGDDTHEVGHAGWYTFLHRFEAAEESLSGLGDGGHLEVEFVLLDDIGDEVWSTSHDQVIVGFTEDGEPVAEGTGSLDAENVGSGYLWLDIVQDGEVEIRDHIVRRIE